MAGTYLLPTPRPGDGAWLLQPKSQQRRGQKKLETLLRQAPNGQYEVGLGSGLAEPDHGLPQGSHDAPNLQSHVVERSGIDLTSSCPRTLATETTPLSRTLHSKIQNSSNSRASQLLSFLRDPNDSEYKIDKQNSHLSTHHEDHQNDMVIPPHLRTKPQQSTDKSSKLVSAANNHNPNDDSISPSTDTKVDSVMAPPQTEKASDIRQRLAKNYGVKVSDPQPAKAALVPYASTDDGDQHPMTGNDNQSGAIAKHEDCDQRPQTSSTTKATKQSMSPQHSKGGGKRGGGEGSSRGRGRGGGGFQSRSARGTKWPTAAEQRPDPHRWDIKWNSESEKKSSSGWSSNEADAGHGGERKKRKAGDAVAKLTDWSGRMAPPPVDWDSRPGFRDNQSSSNIEHWLDRTEEEMVGKTWGVDTDQIDVSDLETNPDSGIDLGEIAPRYWVPIVIGNKAPKTFWHEQVTSEKPKPYDDDDLEGAKPWWELYQSRGSAILKPWIHPEIEGVDPNETRDERLARENDSGSNFHTENRKKKEKAKKDADREKKKLAQEKAQKMHKSSSKIDAPARIKTDVSLYIRGATVQDIPAIREIYNHYVTFSVSTPEIERRTDRDMLSRLKEVRDNKLPFLVACERGQKIGGRGRKKGREDPIILPDKVVGFAFADDYNDMVGMYRFTAEMEVYVDNHNYMKGIGKCLMDKLLGLLDPEHVERGGYDIVGDEAEGIGSSRMIKNLIINMSYDRPEILEWKGRWLTTGLGFKQVGDLQAIGHKDAKTINLAIFQRTTGTNIDAANLPITMTYSGPVLKKGAIKAAGKGG